MSLADFAAHHAELLGQNTDHFAETVRRNRPDLPPLYPAVLVTWETEQLNQGGGRRENQQRGTISHVTDSSLSLADKWVINGHTYATVSVGEPQYGMQAVKIEFRQSDMRGKSLGVL